MAKGHTYYAKMISWSPQLLQKTDIARESVNLRTIDKKLTLNLIVIFISFTDIYFLKYVAKIFCVSNYFQEQISECFKVQLSVAVFLHILSSEGANQLQVLYIRTLGIILGKMQEKFSTESAVLKCILSNFILDTYRSFRETAEKVALENYDLAYHPANFVSYLQ